MATRVEVPGRRSTTQESPAAVEVVIPAGRNFFVMLFIGAWLVGWTMGEIFATRQLMLEDRGPGGGLFLLAWLTMWTVGGVFVWYSLLWMLVGKEIIVLKPDVLSIKKDVFGFGRTREFELGAIKNLRVNPNIPSQFGWGSSKQPWPLPQSGLIAFDYGAKTFRFAMSVDEAEAALIISDLERRGSLASKKSL